jgi:hypothetical protein
MRLLWLPATPIGSKVSPWSWALLHSRLMRGLDWSGSTPLGLRQRTRVGKPSIAIWRESANASSPPTTALCMIRVGLCVRPWWSLWRKPLVNNSMRGLTELTWMGTRWKLRAGISMICSLFLASSTAEVAASL